MVFTTREQVKPTQLTVSQRYCANGCDSCPVREGCYSDAANKSIDIEIRKCIVLCANCHRLLHAKNQCEMKVKEAENEKLLF